MNNQLLPTIFLWSQCCKAVWYNFNSYRLHLWLYMYFELCSNSHANCLFMDNNLWMSDVSRDRNLLTMCYHNWCVNAFDVIFHQAVTSHFYKKNFKLRLIWWLVVACFSEKEYSEPLLPLQKQESYFEEHYW